MAEMFERWVASARLLTENRFRWALARILGRETATEIPQEKAA